MSLLDGFTNGLTRGIDYTARLLKFLHNARIAGNDAAMHDGFLVVEQWLKEATDESGQVKHNLGVEIASAALGGSDPFATSRKMEQDLFTKYPGVLK